MANGKAAWLGGTVGCVRISVTAGGTATVTTTTAVVTPARIASAGGAYVARVDGVETVLSIGFGCAHGPEGDALPMN